MGGPRDRAVQGDSGPLRVPDRNAPLGVAEWGLGGGRRVRRAGCAGAARSDTRGARGGGDGRTVRGPQPPCRARGGVGRGRVSDPRTNRPPGVGGRWGPPGEGGAGPLETPVYSTVRPCRGAPPRLSSLRPPARPRPAWGGGLNCFGLLSGQRGRVARFGVPSRLCTVLPWTARTRPEAPVRPPPPDPHPPGRRRRGNSVPSWGEREPLWSFPQRS